MFEEELWTLISGNPSKLCCNCFFPIIPSTTCLHLGASPSYESCWLYPRPGRFLNKKIFCNNTRFWIQVFNWTHQHVLQSLSGCGVCVFFLLPIPTTGMDKWAIQECEASSCGEWNRSSTVDCLLFKSTTSFSYECSAESHWFSTSFAIPSFVHMGRLQIASFGNAQKTKRFQNIQGMASKHQICMKSPWLRSIKSLWKLHGFEAPNLYENSMTWEHQISLKTPHRPELSETNPKLGVGYWAPDWLKLERKQEVGMKSVKVRGPTY
jgi:hypothetical protein